MRNTKEVIDLLSGNDPMQQKIFNWNRGFYSYLELKEILKNYNDMIKKDLSLKYRVVFTKSKKESEYILIEAFIQKKKLFLWFYQNYFSDGFLFRIPFKSFFGKLQAESYDCDSQIINRISCMSQTRKQYLDLIEKKTLQEKVLKATKFRVMKA